MMTGSMAARPKSDHRARPSDRETREGYRSVRAAARELGLSEPTVRRFIREGAMPAVEIGGSWRIPSSYFEALEAQAYSRCSSAAPLERDIQRPGRMLAAGWYEPDSGDGLRILRPNVERAAPARRQRS
jgi:excisionase family DNA binding protein